MKDHSDMKKEDKLLLLCIRTDLTDEAEIKFLLQNNLNWNYILQKATGNRFIPLLYWNLKSYSDYIPEEYMGIVEGYFHYNIRKNLLMVAELNRLLEIFNYNSIDAMPFKGPALAIDAYHNIGLREFNDLDIYVPRNNMIKVRELLLNEGYYIYYDIGLKKMDKYMEVHNDLKFINKQNNIVLEIHWGFYDDIFSIPSPNKFDVKENEKKIYINNLEVLNPSSEDMFLILCLHNASHRWNSLILLKDLMEFVKSHEINWKYVFDKADKLIVKRILNINLYLVRNILKINLPHSVLKQIEKDKKSLIISQDIQNELLNKSPCMLSLKDEMIITIKLREKFIYGVKDVLMALTTPAIYEWKHLPLPTYLWFIYSIYRPVNLLWRYKW